MASSNHAADWCEHALVHERKMDMICPELLANKNPRCSPAGDSVDAWKCIMVRIGHPHELNPRTFADNPSDHKRHLGAYTSKRDLCQLFVCSIESPSLNNTHGIPWQVVYGISNNTRAFWSLANAHHVLGYAPVKVLTGHSTDLAGEKATPGGNGRVGLL